MGFGLVLVGYNFPIHTRNLSCKNTGSEYTEIWLYSEKEHALYPFFQKIASAL